MLLILLNINKSMQEIQIKSMNLLYIHLLVYTIIHFNYLDVINT